MIGNAKATRNKCPKASKSQLIYFLPAQSKQIVSKTKSKVHENCWFQQMDVLTSTSPQLPLRHTELQPTSAYRSLILIPYKMKACNMTVPIFLPHNSSEKHTDSILGRKHEVYH